MTHDAYHLISNIHFKSPHFWKDYFLFWGLNLRNHFSKSSVGWLKNRIDEKLHLRPHSYSCQTIPELGCEAEVDLTPLILGHRKQRMTLTAFLGARPCLSMDRSPFPLRKVIPAVHPWPECCPLLPPHFLPERENSRSVSQTILEHDPLQTLFPFCDTPCPIRWPRSHAVGPHLVLARSFLGISWQNKDASKPQLREAGLEPWMVGMGFCILDAHPGRLMYPRVSLSLQSPGQAGSLRFNSISGGSLSWHRSLRRQ